MERFSKPFDIKCPSVEFQPLHTSSRLAQICETSEQNARRSILRRAPLCLPFARNLCTHRTPIFVQAQNVNRRRRRHRRQQQRVCHFRVSQNIISTFPPRTTPRLIQSQISIVLLRKRFSSSMYIVVHKYLPNDNNNNSSDNARMLIL